MGKYLSFFLQYIQLSLGPGSMDTSWGLSQKKRHFWWMSWKQVLSLFCGGGLIIFGMLLALNSFYQDGLLGAGGSFSFSGFLGSYGSFVLCGFLIGNGSFTGSGLLALHDSFIFHGLLIFYGSFS